jgi:hypothetical protein
MTHASSPRERSGSPAICCPGNGRPAAPVQLRTVKAMLQPTALRRIGREQHYYCTDARCAIVYFSESGARYGVDDVAVALADKQPGPPRLVCYCFGYVEALPAVANGGAEPEVLGAIRAHVKAGQCACDVKNPSGRCCLSAHPPR